MTLIYKEMGLKYSDKLEFGYVYKIECNLSGMVYYGSTTKTIDHRIKKHTECYDAFMKDETTKRKCGPYEIFKLCNYRVEVLEILFDLTYGELCEREAYYIKNYDCVNIKRPFRTGKEFRIENKEERQLEKQQYYIANKERISKKSKITILCECGLNVPAYAHLSRHKKSAKHLKLISEKS